MDEIIVQSGHAVDSGDQIAPEAGEFDNSRPEKGSTIEPANLGSIGSGQKEIQATTSKEAATASKEAAAGFVGQLPGNLTSAQLDSLCLQRSQERFSITERDIRSVLGRVKGAFEQFSRFMKEIGTPAALKKSDQINFNSTTSSRILPSSEPEDIVVEVIAANNKTIGSRETVDAGMSRLQAQLQKISHEAERGSEGDVGSSLASTVQRIEEVGQALAQSLINFSQMVSKAIDG